jgi:hypothetical protein
VVKVSADGSLEGFDEVERCQDTGAARDAGVVLVAELLGLMVAFIGQSLTLGLTRDAWPDATLDGMASSTGEMP